MPAKKMNDDERRDYNTLLLIQGAINTAEEGLTLPLITANQAELEALRILISKCTTAMNNVMRHYVP